MAENIMRKVMAEEATGIAENPRGLGKLYGDGGFELTPEEAQDLLLKDECVSVPNAGAGSYTKFFTEIGKYQEVETIESGSSAGDWTFGVLDDGVWYAAFQTNRHPYHGFSYSVNRELCADSFESLCKLAEM